MITLNDLVEIKKCFDDWIQTTGFGEVNRRDKAALKIIEAEIQRLSEEIKEFHAKAQQRIDL